MSELKTFEMPRLTEDMKEGVLVAWLVEVGQEFKKGDPLFEIETDKVVSQLEAVESGELVSQLVEEGDKVPVGEIIGEWK